MALNKEIWLPELLEGFYAEDMFLSEARNFDAFVENDKINLAEAGVNPDVLINNTTYPIAVSQRTDIAIALELDTYDTENTLIRNIETAELSYDKRTSVLYGHRQALRMKYMEKAIHAYSPASDDTFTPVLTTSGVDDGSGFKSLSYEDIMDLETRFDDAEIPSEGRVLVLNTNHKKHLKKEDAKLFKEIFKDTMFCGFKIYALASKRMPVFDGTTSQKQAFGSALTGTSGKTSVAFHKDEVMRCMGTMDMFSKLKDPENRGDMYGFQGRALALPIRNKGIGAIYSVAV